MPAPRLNHTATRTHGSRSQFSETAPDIFRGWTALVMATALAACGGGGSGGDGGASPDAAPDAGTTTYLEQLATSADFTRLQGEGWAVKYLAQVAGREPPAPLARSCLFQNTALYPLHLGFLRSFPELLYIDWESYLALTTRSASRVLWAGELQLIPGAEHPRTGRRGVVATFVYADPNEPLGLDQLGEIHARLIECAPFARELLVLVGADPRQVASFAELAPALRARGIEVGDPAALRPGMGAEGYSLGESYGFLRVVPRGQRPTEYGPRDILVTEGSFDDLRLVAGLVTALPQSLHSHVNLRLREKQIPNARLPHVYDDLVVTLLEGKVARLTVTETEAQLRPAELAEAEAYWAAKRPPPRPLRADLTETRLRPFAELAAADALSVGAKAANLGELHRILPAANRAPGFAVPFSVYRDFMEASGMKAQVNALLADPRTATEAPFRRAGLTALRRAIEAAPVPAGLMDRLGAAALAAFGTGYERRPIRFRSSSNVEDGELATGAGLYDSARGCFADDGDADQAGPSACLSADERGRLEPELARRQAEWAAHPERIWLVEIIEDLTSDLSKERTVARALKRVFASLWTERAFEERAYWGMDHGAAFMGVAVNPSFVLEKLDSVAVTHLPAGAAGPLYRVVSQRDGQPVVRPPDPALVAETLTFRRAENAQPADVRLVVPSSLSPEAPLWGEARLQELAGLLFLVQDHFAATVYPHIPGLSLDLEIKLTADDRIVIKQARPYPAP
jgi:pyruvate, water dikinase